MNKPANTPAANKQAAAEAPKEGGIPLVAILILTALGGGLGAVFGMQIPPMPQVEVEKKVAEQTTAKSETIVVPMAPITTNLLGSGRTWIRIESLAVMHADIGDKASAMAARISEDIVAYLRTVTVDQLEGPSGFQHLTEDLNDRVRLRSEGKVTELLVQSMIIE